MRTPLNDLRMRMKEALDNLWARISGKFDTVHGRVDDAEAHIDDVEGELNATKGRVTSVEGRMTTAEGQITGLNTRVGDLEDAVDDLDGAMIKSITFNGTAVPKDAQGNVALQETDPTVPAWAKQAKAKTSDLTNDGDDGINPFITALNLPNNTSDLTNDGDGDSPFATLQQMQAAVAGQYALIDLHTKSQTSWLTIQEMWDELKKVPINENRAFSADSNCSDMISGGETLTLEGIIYPHGRNYTDTIDRYYYMAFDGLGAKIYLGEFNIGRHPVSGEYLCECLEIHTISDSGGGGGGSGAVNTVTFNGVTHQPDSNGNVTFGFTETDPSVPSWAKAAQKPSYTAAEVGAKPTQTAVADPTASGTAVAFIAGITQNTNGVITPTKKTVRSASQSESGLMSATDKAKLDGIAAGAQVNSITGVKGNNEVNYRHGDVNITPENIGAFKQIPGYVTREMLNDYNIKYWYGGRVIASDAAAIGLPSHEWFVLNMSKNDDTDSSWTRQVFYQLGGPMIFERTCSYHTWSSPTMVCVPVSLHQHDGSREIVLAEIYKVEPGYTAPIFITNTGCSHLTGGHLSLYLSGTIARSTPRSVVIMAAEMSPATAIYTWRVDNLLDPDNWTFGAITRYTGTVI